MKSNMKASKFETQTAIAALLKQNGPMSRKAIEDALGRKCENALRSLVGSGSCESFEDANDRPAGRGVHFMTKFYAFVREPGHKPKSGDYSETTVAWCKKVLLQMGYTVRSAAALNAEHAKESK